MNYYRLLKLLYIADRKSIQDTGRPIIGGRFVAMARGPLHSATLDLMQGKDTCAPEWNEQFKTDRYDVEMVADPGNGDLSRREIDTLNAVRMQYEHLDDWAVGEATHEFPEFVKFQPGEDRKVQTIPFAELLSAVGRGNDEESIIRDAKDKSVFDRVFGS
jgi:uncharacterized phage-associated protein